MEIREGRTRFILHPYSKGDAPTLEKRLSIYDPAEFKYTGFLYEYDYHRKLLMVPRGLGQVALESLLAADNITDLTWVDEYDKIPKPRKVSIHMKEGVGFHPDYEEIQKDATKFLIHTPESQRILTLDVGFGKTFCTVYAAHKLSIATLIITKGLVDQWIREIETHTIHREGAGIYRIVGEATILKLYKEDNPTDLIYVASADTLDAMLERGESIQELADFLGIGVKAFDEFHRNFVMNNRIDLKMQVRDTIYLTATVGRSDEQQDRIFKRIYAKVPIHGTHTHLIKQYYYVRLINYDTRPPEHQVRRCTLKRGFNPKIYFKWLMTDKLRLSLFYGILRYYIVKLFNSDENAKVLIIVDSLALIRLLKRMFEADLGIPTGTYCGIIPDPVLRKKELLKRIILSTLNLGSTGLDVPGLRMMQSATTFRSPITTRQTLGRLRRMEGKAVYFLDFCDFGFPSMLSQRESRMREIKPRAHEIVTQSFDLEDAERLLGEPWHG